MGQVVVEQLWCWVILINGAGGAGRDAPNTLGRVAATNVITRVRSESVRKEFV